VGPHLYTEHWFGFVMSGMWWKRVSIADELLGEPNMEVAPYFLAGFFFSICAKKI
jgi:hypothetical protein